MRATSGRGRVGSTVRHGRDTIAQTKSLLRHPLIPGTIQPERPYGDGTCISSSAVWSTASAMA